MVELELVFGSNKMSAKGTLEEVLTLTQLFEKYFEVGAVDEAQQVTNDTRRSPPRKPKPKGVAKSSSSGVSQSSVDAEAIANTIKQRDDFSRIQSQILNKAGLWTEKARLVAFIVDEKITSGDVTRVLGALRVKSSLPTVSKALSGISGEFITEGTSPVFYTMTDRARTEFGLRLSREQADA
ncbi:hypothetical protein ACXN5S_17280 [Pseudoroseicyclus sp. H15]